MNMISTKQSLDFHKIVDHFIFFQFPWQQSHYFHAHTINSQLSFKNTSSVTILKK